MKHLNNIAIFAVLCSLILSSCQDNIEYEHPANKVYQMYCSTYCTLCSNLKICQYAFYVNNYFATGSDELLTQVFGSDYTLNRDDANNTIEIIPASNSVFRCIQITHNGYALTDTNNMAEWDINIIVADLQHHIIRDLMYKQLFDKLFEDGKPNIHYSIHSQHTNDGYVWEIHTYGMRGTLGTSHTDLTIATGSDDFTTSNKLTGTMTMDALFYPVDYSRTYCLLEAKSTMPIDFELKPARYNFTHSPQIRFNNGGMTFHAFNELEQTLDGEVEFHAAGNTKYLILHYKGVREQRNQSDIDY